MAGRICYCDTVTIRSQAGTAFAACRPERGALCLFHPRARCWKFVLTVLHPPWPPYAAVGGLTPWAELLRQIRAESAIPIRCLMRPRPGDFLYTKDEIQLLCRQITALHSAGADGFVIGALTAGGGLDMDATGRLCRAAEGAGLTLHRAIDVSCDPLQTYRDAAALGIDTVLTSGAAANCLAGEKKLEQLLALRDEIGGPQVLIGAGVNAEAIRRLRAGLPGAAAFHMSGKIELESRMRFRREGVPMGLPGLDEWHIQQTSEAAVRAARAALDAAV